MMICIYHVVDKGQSRVMICIYHVVDLLTKLYIIYTIHNIKYCNILLVP